MRAISLAYLGSIANLAVWVRLGPRTRWQILLASCSRRRHILDNAMVTPISEARFVVSPASLSTNLVPMSEFGVSDARELVPGKSVPSLHGIIGVIAVYEHNLGIHETHCLINNMKIVKTFDQQQQQRTHANFKKLRFTNESFIIHFSEF